MFQRKSAIEQVEYISIHDPGLDADAMNHEKYLDAFDPQYMPAKEGETLTRFVLKPIEPAALIRAKSQTSDAARAYELVAYGLKGLKNYRLANGEELHIKLATLSGLERVKLDHLKKIYHEALFVELAAVIYMLSNPDPLSSGGSG